MKKLVSLCVGRVLRNRDITLPEERARIGSIEGWVSIIGNLIIAIVKLVLGLMAASISLLADAAHTASDIFSSLVVLVGFKVSTKGPDKEHPFGHGRVEYLVGLIIALMLVIVGFNFIYTVYTRIIDGNAMTPSLFAAVVTLLTIAAKEAMFHFSRELGIKIDSDALLADAWHHRSDSLTSLLVLIAMVGGLLGVTWLDAAAGFLVALFVIYTGFNIARSSVNRLLGAAPPREVRENMLITANCVKGVEDVHDLIIHDYGQHKSVSLHIEVDGSLTLTEAHEIAQTVEKQLEHEHRCEAVVHLDPYNCEESKEEKEIEKKKLEQES